MILHPEELDRSSFRKLGDFEDLLTTSDTYSGKKTSSSRPCWTRRMMRAIRS